MPAIADTPALSAGPVPGPALILTADEPWAPAPALPRPRRRLRACSVTALALLACAPLLLALAGLAGAWLTPVSDV